MYQNLSNYSIFHQKYKLNTLKIMNNIFHGVTQQIRTDNDKNREKQKFDNKNQVL